MICRFALLLIVTSTIGTGTAFAQTPSANPIYDTSGTNVVPGRYYQLSVASSAFFLGYSRDSSNACIGTWQTHSPNLVQYARFCSDLDCTNTGNRDSMIIQLNCGYVKVEGSTIRMTVDKNEATWFDTIPSEYNGSAGKLQGYQAHVRSTNRYLTSNGPGLPVTVAPRDSGIWLGLTPINGSPTTCKFVNASCSALLPDRMLNKPVYTNTWKNAYLPTKCGSDWKASPLYHKTRILGYRSFKQDNNWNNGRLATQIVDFGRFNSGDVSPTTLVNGRKTKWYSNRACYDYQADTCGIPGLCSPGGKWAGIVVVIFEWLNLDSGGKYCAGTPQADHMYDCCMRAQNEDKAMSPAYYFEQGGEVSLDDRNTWFPMYYVYSYRGGSKVYMRNECNGDDIYWGAQDPSLIYFTNHSVRQGQVWIRYWGKNARGEQVIEEAQDTYVTSQQPVDPALLPKEGEVEFKLPDGIEGDPAPVEVEEHSDG